MTVGLITRSYLDLQRELHSRPEGYGDKGDKWAPAVAALVSRFRATSILDYGAGKGALVRALQPLVDRAVVLSEYDPAMPGKDGRPAPVDLVTCCDVLEHVEPVCLPFVLGNIRRLARKAVFAVISTRSAERTLRDGRNAHLIIQPDVWWISELALFGFGVEPGPKSPLPKPSRELSVILT